jgi:hypothetical protein
VVSVVSRWICAGQQGQNSRGGCEAVNSFIRAALLTKMCVEWWSLLCPGGSVQDSRGRTAGAGVKL